MSKLESIPRLRLATLPTPIYEMKRLAEELGGPRIFVKRDDLTGVAFGGNKIRKLEYLLADAIEADCDWVVTTGAFHSNHCTQTAAACSHLGLGVTLVKSAPSSDYSPKDIDGNHLLQVLFGANVVTAKGSEMDDAVKAAVADLKAQGHRPYLIPDAGSTPVGCIGYVEAMRELSGQMRDAGLEIDCLMHTTGSGGTQSGLIVGAELFSPGTTIISACSGSTPLDVLTEKIRRRVESVWEFLGYHGKSADKKSVNVLDDYHGGGYGFVSEAKIDAIQMVAKTEGVVLDPVYTAASMSALIDLVRKGRFTKDDVIVYLHSGGTAALFPYRSPISSWLAKKDLTWRDPPWSARY